MAARTMCLLLLAKEQRLVQLYRGQLCLLGGNRIMLLLYRSSDTYSSMRSAHISDFLEIVINTSLPTPHSHLLICPE